MRSGDSRPRRCAIYTRKSTDEGLDQAFNSLDAQREACAAYVMSQAHEGWGLDPTIYDDGGFSGGNLERPALTRLLTEVSAGRIDVIVVYKIDRLTRSLMDFAKIVEILDGAGASFVSITQSFNTTTSMGRLTLNVLLSFAQFEREVISERVRDKIAASKAKGMWMGGPVPLGYRVEDRKLIPDDSETRTLRHIMETYLASQSVADLAERLRSQGIVSKIQILRDGRTRGGEPYVRGPLYCMLKNRIYIGEIIHKGKVYPGQHEAIIDRDLFDAVQRKLADSTNNTARGPRKTKPSLLAGHIRDDRGRPMSPTHSVRDGKRYRYYTSSDSKGTHPALRLAAGDLDAAVLTAVARLLEDRDQICDAGSDLDALHLKDLNQNCQNLAERLEAVRGLADADISMKLVGMTPGVSAARRRLRGRLGPFQVLAPRPWNRSARLYEGPKRARHRVRRSSSGVQVLHSFSTIRVRTSLPVAARAIQRIARRDPGAEPVLRERGSGTMDSELHFDRGGQSVRDIERATAALWADLAFDEHARSALKRDGLVLNGLRLTGPSPFVVHEIQNDNDRFAVSADAADASQREALLALWQVHFLKRLREAA